MIRANVAAVSVDPLTSTNGLFEVLVTVLPLAMRITSLFEVSVAPPVMLRSGPPRLALDGDAETPELSPLSTKRTRPKLTEPSMTLVPPSVTVPPVRLMSGDVVVLLRLDRRTSTRSDSAMIVLLVALRSGPARDTDAGATSSAAGRPVVLSATLKKLAPDCESLPVKVELVS